MPIQTRMEQGHAVISVSGRLTLGREVEQLESTVAEQLASGRKKVVIDLSTLDYADSSGIGTMVSCLTQVKQAGGELRLAGVNPRLLKMFKMTGIDVLIDIFPTVADAAAC